MKSFRVFPVLCFFLLLPVSSIARAADPDKRDPASYTTSINVVGSAVDYRNNFIERLIVVVNGDRQVWVGNGSKLLKLGEYKAFPLERAKSGKPYDAGQRYRILLPDGSNEMFFVTAIGESVPAPVER
ncbi:hypothetical protein ACFQBQ_10160 [Granulicella cerasi]|uniref:Uncharacterized protein n=1 Tax=Granulicella cerasi TaxID=741063 RepID=A0ABW1Z9S9_9BACT|nr:hypothetical protein [Granulicella cerasi]